MKRYRFKIFIVGAILLGTSELANAACSQTLSPGAAVASAISSASAGSTICLNPGSYGTVTLGAFTKSPPVIVQSVTALGASMGLRAQNGANGVTFDGIDFSSGGGTISSSSTKNITIKNSAFGTNQLVILTTNFNNNNILIDHNTFGAFNASGGYEGRLHITWGAGAPGATPSGVTVTNNTFGPGGCSDGIQIGALAVTVGPGNVFTGLVQGSCGPHVDAIQGYGQANTVIMNNHFTGNTIDVGIYDGGNKESITGNLMEKTQVGSSCGDCNGSTWTHNTVTSGNWGINGKTLSGSNALVSDNIFLGASGFTFYQGGSLGCTSNCVATHNLFQSSGSGTNNLIGTPTFTGGTSPATWAGWQLSTGSLGKYAATDGQDMGITYYGAITGTPPPPSPTNLQVK